MAKKNNNSKYELVLDNGMDLAVQRSNDGDPAEILVLLPSQNQYYIKNLNTGSLVSVTTKNLIGFFDSLDSGYNSTTIRTDTKWLPRLENDKDLWKAIPACITDERFVPAVKSGIFSIGNIVRLAGRWGFSLEAEINKELDKASASWRFMRSYRKNNKNASEVEMNYVEKAWPACRVIMDRFGLDNARTWAKAMYDCHIYAADMDTKLAMQVKELLNKVFTKKDVHISNHTRQEVYFTHDDSDNENVDEKKKTVFDFKTLLKYTTENLVQEGFRRSPESYWEMWKDTLSLETYCFDRIVDKYPELLRSTHQALSAMAARMEFEVDPEKEAAAVERMAKLDWKPINGDYLITHPVAMSDLRKEAQEQSNCLASYIDSVARGDTQILFLRPKTNPNHAYITIEVDMNNRVVQALGKFNTEPNDEAWYEIRRWAQARNLNTDAVLTRLGPAAARQEKLLESKKDNN